MLQTDDRRRRNRSGTPRFFILFFLCHIAKLFRFSLFLLGVRNEVSLKTRGKLYGNRTIVTRPSLVDSEQSLANATRAREFTTAWASDKSLINPDPSVRPGFLITRPLSAFANEPFRATVAAWSHIASTVHTVSSITFRHGKTSVTRLWFSVYVYGNINKLVGATGKQSSCIILRTHDKLRYYRIFNCNNIKSLENTYVFKVDLCPYEDLDRFFIDDSFAIV